MDDSGDDEFGAHRYFQVDAQLYAAPAEDDPAEPHFQNPSKHLRENSPETDASRRGVAAAAVPARASDELARASQPSKRKRGLVLTQEEEAAWAAARAQAAQFVGVSANRKSSNGWDLTFCFCPCFEGRYLSVLPTAEAAARAWDNAAREAGRKEMNFPDESRGECRVERAGSAAAAAERGTPKRPSGPAQSPQQKQQKQRLSGGAAGAGGSEGGRGSALSEDSDRERERDRERKGKIGGSDPAEVRAAAHARAKLAARAFLGVSAGLYKEATQSFSFVANFSDPVRGVYLHLGEHFTAEAAAKSWDATARRYGVSTLNFPDGPSETRADLAGGWHPLRPPPPAKGRGGAHPGSGPAHGSQRPQHQHQKQQQPPQQQPPERQGQRANPKPDHPAAPPQRLWESEEAEKAAARAEAVAEASHFVGVHVNGWRAGRRKYCFAAVYRGRANPHVGTFQSAEEAARAWDEVAREHGISELNFPEGPSETQADPADPPLIEAPEAKMEALREAAKAAARRFFGVRVTTYRHLIKAFAFTSYFGARYLGTFNSPEEAGKAWDVAAREAGSRKINFPRPGESHDPMSSSEEDEEDGDDAAEGPDAAASNGQKSIIARKISERKQRILRAAEGTRAAAAAAAARPAAQTHAQAAATGSGAAAGGDERELRPAYVRKSWRDEPVDIFVPGRAAGRRRQRLRPGRRMHYRLFGESSDSDSGPGARARARARVAAVAAAVAAEAAAAGAAGNDSGGSGDESGGGGGGGGEQARRPVAASSGAALTLSDSLEALRCPSWWLTGGLASLVAEAGGRVSIGLGLRPTLVELPLNPSNHNRACRAVERAFDNTPEGRAVCVQFGAAWGAAIRARVASNTGVPELSPAEVIAAVALFRKTQRGVAEVAGATGAAGDVLEQPAAAAGTGVEEPADGPARAAVAAAAAAGGRVAAANREDAAVPRAAVAESS